MARPGQNQARRKREYPHDSDTEEEEGAWRAGVLPVAKLPDDWEGQVEDGATYLAVIQREAAQLPFTTRAKLPLSSSSKGPGPAHYHGSDVEAAAGPSVEDEFNAANPNQPGPSRHPALPSPSWELLFPVHFKGYRDHLQASLATPPSVPTRPPDPPVPRSDDRSGWYMYIHGLKPTIQSVSRRRTESDRPSGATNGTAVSGQNSAAGTAEDEERDHEFEEGDEWADEEATLNEEEEAMNADPVRPREPSLYVLAGLQAYQLIRILGHLNHWITETLDLLSPSLLLPTSPTSPSLTSNSNSLPAIRQRKPRKIPLPHLYAQWVFALLLLLPRGEEMMPDNVSDLRALGRTAMKVGGWRWVRAVGEGEIQATGDHESQSISEGLGGHARGERAVWTLGGKQGVSAPAPARSTDRQSGLDEAGPGRNDAGEDGLDETLARCWLIVYAIAGGWGQWDLVEELRTLFS